MTPRDWDVVRAFALSLPDAAEDVPWGETVVKIERQGEKPAWRRHLVHGPMFLWLGRPDPDVQAVAVKLRDSYHQAVGMAGAQPTSHSGLGQWGWLTVTLGRVEVDLVCDWVEESYRSKATRKHIARLDSMRR